MDRDEVQRRLYAMLWCHAVGDALGAPYERRGAMAAFEPKVHLPITCNSRFQGKRVGVVGQVTDDTEMTVIVARCLLDSRGYARDEHIQAYMRWANRTGSDAPACPFMGTNTRNLFAGVTTIKGYTKRYETSGCEKSQSNGVMMRISPLSVLPDGERVDAVITETSVSNPNPFACVCSVVYVEMLAAAIRFAGDGERVTAVLERGRAAIDEGADAITDEQRREIEAILAYGESDRPDTRRIDGADKGWCAHALYCAVIALRYPTYEEAITAVVRKGGDTDTNAAVAGALYGAVFPDLSAITDENILLLSQADTTEGDLPRPDEYHPRHLTKFARKLTQTFFA